MHVIVFDQKERRVNILFRKFPVKLEIQYGLLEWHHQDTQIDICTDGKKTQRKVFETILNTGL